MHCFLLKNQKKKRKKQQEKTKTVKDEHYSGFIRKLTCFIAATDAETRYVIKLMKIK